MRSGALFAVALALIVSLESSCVTDRDVARYDYVVVGAGAAGSVLAHRLTEDPATSVLVLEAGGPDDDPRIRQPSAFRQLLDSPFNWGESTVEEPHLNGRRVPLPRGRGWGGGGTISAMVYVRGHAWDFDRWEQLGNPGWGYDDVLPYFKKAENLEGGASEYHGVGGPQNVAYPRWVPPISGAFVQAALQAGLPRNEDFNGERQEGVGFYQLNQKDGERHSAAGAYLRPALERDNLTVENHARATRVLFEVRRAVGVSYVQDERTHEVRASREVILSAGTIGSAQLLLLSGVGPAEQLSALGIAVVHDLPGVGENLQDHPRVALTYASAQPLGLTDAEQERAQAEYEEERTGPFSSNGVGAGAFVRLSPEDPAPGIQIILTANPAANTFSLQTALMHPGSRGSLRLRSTDPTETPAIEVNYLAEESDLEGLVQGLEVARRIGGAEALAPFRGDELGPGPQGWEPEALREYVRDNVGTFFHPIGTCRMGTDEGAVVDAELRVRGVEGLRVIDASVMPTLLSGATHAATVMIAEKGADLLIP
ncbi:MAG: GMC family oxidoreductase N-terminal domain-containing protein [Acidobacteriota bacterium]|jgi:choline dehydrogenase